VRKIVRPGKACLKATHRKIASIKVRELSAKYCNLLTSTPHTTATVVKLLQRRKHTIYRVALRQGNVTKERAAKTSKKRAAKVCMHVYMCMHMYVYMHSGLGLSITGGSQSYIQPPNNRSSYVMANILSRMNTRTRNKEN
jgi:hypothetical protein